MSINTRACQSVEEAIEAIGWLLDNVNQFAVQRQNGEWLISWPLPAGKSASVNQPGPEVA